MGPGGKPGAGPEELGPHLHGRQRPSLAPRAALQGDPDGTLGGGRGVGGRRAGESRAASSHQVRDKTRQKPVLGLGRQGENR